MKKKSVLVTPKKRKTKEARLKDLLKRTNRVPYRILHDVVIEIEKKRDAAIQRATYETADIEGLMRQRGKAQAYDDMVSTIEDAIKKAEAK